MVVYLCDSDRWVTIFQINIHVPNCRCFSAALFEFLGLLFWSADTSGDFFGCWSLWRPNIFLLVTSHRKIMSKMVFLDLKCWFGVENI